MKTKQKFKKCKEKEFEPSTFLISGNKMANSRTLYRRARNKEKQIFKTKLKKQTKKEK